MTGPSLFTAVIPSPPSYAAGHVKRNPENGEVAIRTAFDDSSPELANMAWLGATISGGPRHYSTSAVADWNDLYVPPVVASPPLEAPLITNPTPPDSGSTA